MLPSVLRPTASQQLTASAYTVYARTPFPCLLTQKQAFKPDFVWTRKTLYGRRSQQTKYTKVKQGLYINDWFYKLI